MNAPHASLRIDRRQGELLVTVDCPSGSTALVLLNGGALALGAQQLAVVAAFAHRERCGHCVVDHVLDQGDQEFRAALERVLAERLLAERRN